MELIKCLSYVLKKIRSTLKRYIFLGIPIILVLVLITFIFGTVISSYTHNYSEMFKKIDENSIMIDIDQINQTGEDFLKENRVSVAIFDNRINFNQHDVNRVKEMKDVENIDLFNNSMSFFIDSEGNELSMSLNTDDFPKNINKGISSMQKECALVFKRNNLKKASMIHYNQDGITLISGEYPEDGSDDILIPDIVSFLFNKEFQAVPGQFLPLTVKKDTTSFEKKYKVSGVHKTTYETHVPSELKIYLGSKEIQNENLVDYYAEISNAMVSMDSQTKKYLQPILSSETSFENAYGSGKNSMIISLKNNVDHKKIEKELEVLFPFYNQYSQYSLKKGELSKIYINTILKIIVIMGLTAFIFTILLTIINRMDIKQNNKEWAILYCQGYRRKEILFMTFSEKLLTYIAYFLTSQIIVFILNFFYFSKSENNIYINKSNLLLNMGICALFLIFLLVFLILIDILRLNKKTLITYLQ